MNRFFDIRSWFPARIPRLYFGALAAPRKLSGRDKLAEAVYIFLVLLSYILFVVGGLSGYLYNRWNGLIIFAVCGVVIGMWMRRSLGLRGRRPASGFFRRMRERAQGSKPGLLEWCVEGTGGSEFTQMKCRAVTLAHEKAVKGLKQAKSSEAQNKILAELDRRVGQILLVLSD
jgi:hypothetical protein